MLLRLSYLALTEMIRFFRLLAMSNADKNIEILTLRVGCQKSFACPDLDMHVRRWPAMKIKTTHSSPTASDVKMFSRKVRGQ